MTTTVQIRQSATAGHVPSSLANGELGINITDQVLYSSNGTVFRIVGAPSGGTGANTQIEFNDSGWINSSAAFTFNKTGNIISVGNVINISVAANVGSNLNISTSTILIGNSTVNSITNSSIIQISNSTSISSLNPNLLSIGNSTINVQSNSTIFAVYSNSSVILPTGTTSQRPTASNGMIRYNSNNGMTEFYSNGAWGQNSLKGISMFLQGNAASNGTYYFTGYAPSTMNLVSVCSYTIGGGTANIIIQVNGVNTGLSGSTVNCIANTTTTSTVNVVSNNMVSLGNPITALVNNSTITSGNNLVIMLNYV